MSKRSQTVFTFTIKILAPTGMNGQDLQRLIRESVQACLPNDYKEEFTVGLIKKETTYGQR